MTNPTIFRLISLKHQLLLEEKGLKSSGGPIRPRIHKEFNLGPRSPYSAFLCAVEKKIAQAVSEEVGERGDEGAGRG